MKLCTNCGAEIADESKFCSNCGMKMEETADAVTSSGEIDIKYEDTLENSYYDTPSQELDIHYEEEEVYGGKEIFVVPQPQFYQENIVNEGGAGNVGFAIASMVCGILSLVCCCLTWLSLLLGIAGIALGVISLKGKFDGRGMAIAGVVCGGIGVAVWVILLLLGGAVGLFGDLLDF